MADSNPTLLDQIKRTDPDGQIADIVEVLTERNPILMDATAMEGNLPTGDRVTVRASEPTPTWRAYNEGVDATKSTTVQVDETTGLLNDRSKVDCALARLNGNEAAFRRSEDLAHVSGMNKEVAETLFYGNVATSPKEFHGLTPRFNDVNLTNVVNYATVSGDTASGAEQSSIWVITWHPDTCYLIYPKGSQAGLRQDDMGKQLTNDSQGTPKQFWAWVTEFEWQIGLVVKDWRYVARICNIDSSTIAFDGAHIENSLIEAVERIHDLGMGRTAIYMNRQTRTWLRRQTTAKSTMNFTPTEWHGKPVMGFQEIPIIAVDALDTTEAVVA